MDRPVARVLAISFVAVCVLIGGVILGQILTSNRQSSDNAQLKTRIRGTETALNTAISQLDEMQKCVLAKGTSDAQCRKLATQPAPVIKIDSGGTTRVEFPGSRSSSSSSSGSSHSSPAPTPRATPRPTAKPKPKPTPKPTKTPRCVQGVCLPSL